MRITTEWLQQHNSCTRSLDNFQYYFNGDVDITKNTLELWLSKNTEPVNEDYCADPPDHLTNGMADLIVLIMFLCGSENVGDNPDRSNQITIMLAKYLGIDISCQALCDALMSALDEVARNPARLVEAVLQCAGFNWTIYVNKHESYATG